MVVFEKVLEVKRLLDEGGLSRRAIAQATGVSRGTVNAIANGDRGLYGAEPMDGPLRPQSASASRCPECGGLVYLPCVLCEARRHRMSLGRAA
jgi:Helix-turn-helix